MSPAQVAAGDLRAEGVEPLCADLVDAVRALDPGRVRRLLATIDQPAALVVLAAMVTEATGHDPRPDGGARPDSQGQGETGRARRHKPRPRPRLTEQQAQQLAEEGAALAYTPDQGWHLLAPWEWAGLLERIV